MHLHKQPLMQIKPLLANSAWYWALAYGTPARAYRRLAADI